MSRWKNSVHNNPILSRLWECRTVTSEEEERVLNGESMATGRRRRWRWIRSRNEPGSGRHDDGMRSLQALNKSNSNWRRSSTHRRNPWLHRHRHCHSMHLHRHGVRGGGGALGRHRCIPPFAFLAPVTNYRRWFRERSSLDASGSRIGVVVCVPGFNVGTGKRSLNPGAIARCRMSWLHSTLA